VSVVDHAAILLALRAHRIVSAMAATMRLDHHLTHPIASRSGQSVAHRQPQCPMANEIVIAAGRSGGTSSGERTSSMSMIVEERVRN